MRTSLVGNLFLAGALGWGTLVYGQSWPQASWWSLEPTRFNPATSAQAFTLSGTGWLRRQWINVPGAPTTLGATLVSPVYRIRAGVGLGLENDQIGASTVTQVRFSGALALLRRENFDISLGAGASYRSAQLDGAQLRTDDGEYGSGIVNHRDILLPNGSVSATAIGVDVGVAVKFGETSFGVSATDINVPAGNFTNFTRAWPRTFLAFAKTTIPVSEQLDLQIGALASSDVRVTQAQIHAFVWYAGNIGAGAAFRGLGRNSADAASLLLGWRASQTLTFAYAYDAGLSALKSVHDGSHELSVRFALTEAFGRGRLPPVIYSPRL